MGIKKSIATLRDIISLDVVLIPVSPHSGFIPDPYCRILVSKPEIYSPYIASCKNGSFKEVGHCAAQCRETGALFFLYQASCDLMRPSVSLDPAYIEESIKRIDKRFFESAGRIIVQPCIRTKTDWVRFIEPIFIKTLCEFEPKLHTVFY